MTNPADTTWHKLGTTLAKLIRFGRNEPWLRPVSDREPRWKWGYTDCTKTWTDSDGFHNDKSERIVTQVVRDHDGSALINIYSPAGSQSLKFDSFKSLCMSMETVRQAIKNAD